MSARDASGRPLQFTVVGVGLGGLAVIGALLWLSAGPSVDEVEASDGRLVLLFAVVGMIAELVYVPIRRGDSSEDLTFIELAFAAALLSLPTAQAVLMPLIGIAIALLLLRMGWVKSLFNLGSNCLAAAAMATTYIALVGTDPYDVQGVIALVTATLVFSTVNLVFMSWVLHVAEGSVFTDTLSEEWRLSFFMGISCAGVSLVAVSVAQEHAALLPFTALPVFALWFAYRAAAQHAQERTRTRWLLALGETLASISAGRGGTAEALEAIRGVFGAHQAQIADSSGAVLFSTGARDHIIPALEQSIDVGAPERGTLSVGYEQSTRAEGLERFLPWAARQTMADEPMANTLAAALGSALRSGNSVEALAEQTARLSAVVNHASDGIAVIDDEGRVLLWSPALTAMTGILSASAQDSCPPELIGRLAAAIADPDNRSTGRQSAFELQVQRASNDVRDLNVSGVRTEDSGTGVWVLTVRDLTRERRVERLKSDFVATISHELRTPITPIRGYARLLASRGERLEPHRRQAALEMMADRAEHLTRLVDDLLLASRVADGSRLAVETGDVALSDIVTQAAASFPGLNGRLSILAPPEEVVVRCDRVRAVQCLSNLLGNAEKYTPALSTVRLSASLESGMVAIRIEDEGPGIPLSERERIFDRFYRIEDPFTSRTGGAGLGLHIARELATAMGGSLTLEDTRGAGATFALSLPLGTRALAGAAPRVAHAWLPYETDGANRAFPAQGR